MARLAAWVAIATVAAVVVGCGPGKELPAESDIITPTDPGEKPVAVPAESAPDARAYVEKAVKAFTAGKPELVAKGKYSRTVLKGTMTLPIDNQKTPFQTTRTIVAGWPDRFTGINELSSQGLNMPVGTWIRESELSVRQGTVDRDVPNRGEYLKNTLADVAAQHWMPLLLPLVEPKAIVFDYQSASIPSLQAGPQAGQAQDVKQIKFALPDYPLFQLTFDAKTDLLVRVEYTTMEQGVRRRKQWSALEHKAGPDGQMVPSKTEMRHEGQLVEQWEIEKWEFPAKIDDSEFSPKK